MLFSNTVYLCVCTVRIYSGLCAYELLIITYLAVIQIVLSHL